MRLTDVIEAITMVAVIIVAVFEVQQLRRNPADPALRVLVPGLVLLATTLFISLPVWPLTVVDEIQDDTGLGNVIWMTMSACYALFFLYADRTRAIRDRHRIALGIAAAFAVCAVIHLAAAAFGTSSAEPRYYWTATNYIFVLSCYAFALAVFGAGTVWALRYLRRVRHWWLRLAIKLVAAGATGMSLGVDLITIVRSNILYVIFPDVKYPWLSTLYNTGRLGGQLLLAAGLLLAPTAAVVLRVRQRRDRARQDQAASSLDSLWELLVAEVPYVVLSSQRLEGSFDRRTAEITDALTRLAPYVPPEHRVGGAPTASDTATMVRAAMAARAAARSAGHVEDAWNEGPYPVLEPDFGGRWRARARWMGELSEELSDSANPSTNQIAAEA